MTGRMLAFGLGCAWLGTAVATALWWAGWHFLHVPRCRGTREALERTTGQLDLARDREMKAYQRADEACRLIDEAREDARRARNQLDYVAGLNTIHDLGRPLPDDLINRPGTADDLSDEPAGSPEESLDTGLARLEWHANNPTEQ